MNGNERGTGQRERLDRNRERNRDDERGYNGGNEQWRRGQESGWPAYGGARSGGYGNLSEHRNNEGWRSGYAEQPRGGQDAYAARDEYGDGGYGRNWDVEQGYRGGRRSDYGFDGDSSGAFWSGQSTRREDYGGQRWQGQPGWDRDRGANEWDRQGRYESGYGRPSGGGYGSYAWSGMVGPGSDEGWGEGPHRGKGPRGYQRSDERIREEVADRLEQHGWIDASELEVDARDGIVTLRGEVDDRRQKRMAEDIVEQISGVKDVRNELRVHGHAEYMRTQGGSHGQEGETGQGTGDAARAPTTVESNHNHAVAHH
jgi:hypothetical protein